MSTIKQKKAIQETTDSSLTDQYARLKSENIVDNYQKPEPVKNFYPQIFDAAVANPPYQLSTGGNNNVRNVFNENQEVADAVAKNNSFIYPAMRWVSGSGKGCMKFGVDQLSSPTLANIVYWRNNRDVFEDVRIKDGISVVHHSEHKAKTNPENMAFNITAFVDIDVSDKKRAKTKPSVGLRKFSGEVDYSVVNNANKVDPVLAESDDYIAGGNNRPRTKSRVISLDPRVNEILKKVWDFEDEHNLFSLSQVRPFPRSLYGISSDFVEKNSGAAQLVEENLEAKGFEDPVKIITNHIGGVNGRSKWFWVERSNIPINADKLPYHKVVCNSRNYSGVGEAEDPNYDVYAPDVGFGRAKGCFALLKDKASAELFYEYITSDVVRFLLASPNDDNYRAMGVNVPVLGLEYLADIVGTDNSMDEVLINMFGITDTEYKFIGSVVDGLGGDYRS